MRENKPNFIEVLINFSKYVFLFNIINSLINNFGINKINLDVDFTKNKTEFNSYLCDLIRGDVIYIEKDLQCNFISYCYKLIIGNINTTNLDLLSLEYANINKKTKIISKYLYYLSNEVLEITPFEFNENMLSICNFNQELDIRRKKYNSCLYENRKKVCYLTSKLIVTDDLQFKKFIKCIKSYMNNYFNIDNINYSFDRNKVKKLSGEKLIKKFSVNFSLDDVSLSL